MTDITISPYNRAQKALAALCAALPGIFLLITSTTFLVDGQFVYDVKRILELFLLLVLFITAGLSTGIRGALATQLQRIPRWLAVVLALIIALGVVSSYWSATSTQQAMHSLMEVALLSLLVVAAFILGACRVVAGRLFDQVAISLLAICAIAVGAQELLGVAAALANQLEFFSRISLMHYSWPRFYNQVQAWVIPALGLLPMIWARSGSEIMRSRLFQVLVCLLALALHWYIILMTGGRGVAISLLFTFLLCLVVLPATRLITLRWHLPGLVLGALLFFAIAQVNEHVQAEKAAGLSLTTSEQGQPATGSGEGPGSDRKDSFSAQSMSGRLSLDSSGRLPMWRGSIQYIRENPVLGIGPMNYACIGPEYRAGHPHNFALQFAAEWGLLAMLGLIIVVGYIAAGLWKALRRDTDQYETRLASMLSTGLIAAAAYSCLSGVLIMPASQVMGMLIGGWLLGTLPLKQRRQSTEGRRAALVTVLALSVSLPLTAYSLAELSERAYRESIIAVLDQGIPRYWQQGKQCKYIDDY